MPTRYSLALIPMHAPICSWYSVTPEAIARDVARRWSRRGDVVIDAFTGSGASAIQVRRTYMHTHPHRCTLAFLPPHPARVPTSLQPHSIGLAPHTHRCTLSLSLAHCCHAHPPSLSFPLATTP